MGIELSTPELSTITFEANEYRLRDIQAAKDFFRCVGEHYIGAELKHVFEKGENSGNLHYEYSTVYLKLEPYKVVITFSDYRKKYHIGAHFQEVFKHLSSDKIQSIYNKHTEPKQIGVLNSKKISDWLAYIDTVYKELVLLEEQNLSTEQEFLNSISTLPVVWYVQNKKGYVLRGGLRFEFEIQNGHVYKTLKVDTSTTLENFLAMSENKLK